MKATLFKSVWCGAVRGARMVWGFPMAKHLKGCVNYESDVQN